MRRHRERSGRVRTGIAMHHGRKENNDHLCQVVVECTSCRRRRRRTVFVISAAKISELAMFSLKEPYCTNKFEFSWENSLRFLIHTVSLIHSHVGPCERRIKSAQPMHR